MLDRENVVLQDRFNILWATINCRKVQRRLLLSIQVKDGGSFNQQQLERLWGAADRRVVTRFVVLAVQHIDIVVLLQQDFQNDFRRVQTSQVQRSYRGVVSLLGNRSSVVFIHKAL